MNVKLNTKAMAIISESFKLTRGLKWPIFKRNILITILSGLIILVQFSVLLRLLDVSYSPTSSYLNIALFYTLTLITVIMIFKLYIPIFLMGVNQALGLPVDINLIKYECSAVKKELFKLVIFYGFLAVTYAFFFIYLNTLIIYNILHLVFGLIFTFIFTPICLLSIPLITKEKKVFHVAINSSYESFFLNWIPILGSYIIFTTISTIIFITLTVGKLWLIHHIPNNTLVLLPLINIIPFIWLLPMLVTIGGVVYRDIFSLKNHAKKPN